jgi:integrase
MTTMIDNEQQQTWKEVTQDLLDQAEAIRATLKPVAARSTKAAKTGNAPARPDVQNAPVNAILPVENAVSTKKPRKQPTDTEDAAKKKKPNPPNCYKLDGCDSWTVEFQHRGRTYKKTIGEGSWTYARDTAAARRKAVRDGELAVNGFLWNNSLDRWDKEKVMEPEEAIPDIPFADLIDKWLTVTKSERPASYKTNFYNSLPIREFFKDYTLSQVSVNPFLVDSFITHQRQACECVVISKLRRCPQCGKRSQKLSDATVRHQTIVLKALFKRAIEWKLVTENPTKHVKVGIFKPTERKRFLSEEEAARLLEACSPQLRDVVLLGLHSGMRSAEIKKLRWPNINMSARTITVTGTKNGDDKLLPMSDPVCAMLERIAGERNHKPDGPVFLSRYGRPMKSFRTAWEAARKAAKLEDVHFHDLRHSFASFLVANGIATKALMELMGHRTEKMVHRYSHLTDEYKCRAVVNLPDFSESPEKSPDGENSTEGRVLKMVVSQ